MCLDLHKQNVFLFIFSYILQKGIREWEHERVEGEAEGQCALPDQHVQVWRFVKNWQQKWFTTL